MLKRLAFALCLVLPAMPALAFDDSDKAAITTSFDQLISTLNNGQYDDVLAVTPPRMLDLMAQQAGMTTEALRAVTIAQTRDAFSRVTLESTSYDMDKATIGTSSTGRDYAMIPTTTIVKVGEDRVEATGSTLAVDDDGTWNLIRIESPAHMQMVGQAYPDLADLPLPPSSMRELE